MMSTMSSAPGFPGDNSRPSDRDAPIFGSSGISVAGCRVGPGALAPRPLTEPDLWVTHPADQLQDPRIRDLMTQPAQEPLVMDAVEELREVDIDHDPVPVANILLRLGDRCVCPAFGTESVAA